MSKCRIINHLCGMTAVTRYQILWVVIMVAEDETGVAPSTVLADPEFRYYPLWDVRANGVFCYICEPFWNVGDGVSHPEEDFPQAFADPRRLLALDLDTLRHAVIRVEEVAEGYGVISVMIPVHYATLANAETRQAYTEACNASVWSVIDSLNFEIIRPPSPLSGTELTEIIGHIRPFGYNVGLRVDADFTQFEDIPVEDLDSLGLDIRGDDRPENVILDNLQDFSSRAGSRGVSRYVHGIETPSLSLAAVAAGYDYVGSDAIAESLVEWAPDGNTVTPVDLLKTLLESKGS